MRVDKFVDDYITQKIRGEESTAEATYVSSGKLSASQLGWPLQWQLLKALGVKPPPPDDYTLRKFARGRHVEDWFIKQLPDVVDSQQKVTYKGAVGRYDAVVDTQGWNFKVGIIPLEVKSVTNQKFKYIHKRKESDRSHMLQGAFYALATGAEYYGIAYVASDDYRIRVHIHTTKELQREIDGIIDRFDVHLGKREVPVFMPAEPWHANPRYNTYPEWAPLTVEQIRVKLKKEYGL